MIKTSVGRNGLLAQTPRPIPTMGKRMINYSVYMLPNQMDEKVLLYIVKLVELLVTGAAGGALGSSL